MKVIEVVVLLGAHCISPVENTAAVTEVGKVQCAVVIEKDTAAGTFRIIPAGASREPEVVAVLERLDGGHQTTIQPAFAPPVAGVPAAGLPAAPPAVSAAAPSPSGAAEEAEEPAQPVSEPAPEAAAKAKPEAKPKEKAPETGNAKAEPEEAAGKPHKCLGEARPRWYTNAEGRRKYRCVIPG